MKKHLPVAVAALAGLVLTTACGSGGGPVADGEMPAEIEIVSVTDKTGLTAFGGQPQFRGIELAVEQINEQDYLDGSRISLRSRDAASDTQTAVSQAVEATADRSVSAMIGGISSAQATAISPLAERSGLPTIYTQSASDGVLIGDYTFRATPPQTTHVATSMAHLQQLGVRRLSVLYNAGNPALTEMAEKNLVEGQDEYGFEIVSATAVQNSTQDFATSASKIAAEKPDAVAMLIVGAQNATAMRQLRQAGYDGPVLGQTGAGTGNLAPAGADGAGMFWTTNFTVDQPFPSSQAFVSAYRAKYGEDPVNYAAEGYDAAWMIAHAIKAAGGASRQDIQRGLEVVLENGFEGAQGSIGFEGHDMRTAGVLVEWDGTREVVLMEPAKT
ncbi:ABC transporter substrate-binding protein [Rhodococcus sp. C26F]